MPVQGEIYERYVHQDYEWISETRHVLCVSDGQICYERVYPQTDGTITAECLVPDIYQVPVKDWQAWATLARKLGNIRE